jgi:predicted nucleotidyltransferase
MRLSSHTREVIRDAVREVFGAEAEVLVFGSRAVDTVRGGDIDLLVRLPYPVEDRQRKALTVTARLQRRLGDQPIDVLVLDPDTPDQPIYRQALRTGVPL